MNRLTRTLVGIAGATALALALTALGDGQAIAQSMKPILAEIVNGYTNPVPVTAVVSAADRVQLEIQGGPSDVCVENTRHVRRVMADGTAIGPFSVPAGKILVLTDLSGEIAPSVPWTAGNIGVLTAFIGEGVRFSARGQLNADAVAVGVMTLSVHSQSGAFGGPGGAVCVGATQLHANGFTVADVARAQLQGYLIPE